MNSNRNNRFERLESCGSSTIRTSSLSTSTSTLSDDSADDTTVPGPAETTVINTNTANHHITIMPNNNNRASMSVNQSVGKTVPTSGALPLSIQVLSDSLANAQTQINIQPPSTDRPNRPPEITVTVDPMPNQSSQESIAPPTPSRFTVQNIDFIEFPPQMNVARDARHSFGYHLTTSNSHTFTPSLLPHCYKNLRHNSVANAHQLTADFFIPPKFLEQRKRAKSHTLSEYERRHLAKFAANYPQLNDSIFLTPGTILSGSDSNNNGALQLINTPPSSDGKLTWKLLLSALVCFFTNSLPSGFNMGVVNTPGATFKQFFNLTLSASFYHQRILQTTKISLIPNSTILTESNSDSNSTLLSLSSLSPSASLISSLASSSSSSSFLPSPSSSPLSSSLSLLSTSSSNISAISMPPTITFLPDEQTIELYWSVAVSLLLIGAFVGCIFTGAMANTFGRRKSLFLNGIFGLIGVFLCWSSNYFPSVLVFMAGRFVSGLHTGVASSLVPMYLMEIAPKNLQTPLGIVHVTGMNGGQMVAQILGLGTVFGTLMHWPLLFFVNACFIIIGLIGLFFIEESPVYLFVMKGEEKQAIESMKKIRAQNLSDLTEDIMDMRQAQKDQETSSVSLIQSLRSSPMFVRCLLTVCLLHAGQQLIGINAIFFYSTKVFRSVGLDAVTAQYSSIGCTALNTVTASVIAIPLIRRFCCRSLLLASCTGTLLVLIGLPVAMAYKDSSEWAALTTIVLILAFVFIFALGLGPIPYMIGGELFDRSTMAVGMSVGCFVNWLCNFGIAITFPLITMAIDEFVFIIFAFFNAALLMFIYFCIPKN